VSQSRSADSAKWLSVRTDPGKRRYSWGPPDQVIKDAFGNLIPDGKWITVAIEDCDFMDVNSLLNHNVEAGVALVLAAYRKGHEDGFDSEALPLNGMMMY